MRRVDDLFGWRQSSSFFANVEFLNVRKMSYSRTFQSKNYLPFAAKKSKYRAPGSEKIGTQFSFSWLHRKCIACFLLDALTSLNVMNRVGWMRALRESKVLTTKFFRESADVIQRDGLCFGSVDEEVSFWWSGWHHFVLSFAKSIPS